jgi:hypothetical protein
MVHQEGLKRYPGGLLFYREFVGLMLSGTMPNGRRILRLAPRVHGARASLPLCRRLWRNVLHTHTHTHSHTYTHAHVQIPITHTHTNTHTHTHKHTHTHTHIHIHIHTHAQKYVHPLPPTTTHLLPVKELRDHIQSHTSLFGE